MLTLSPSIGVTLRVFQASAHAFPVLVAFVLGAWKGGLRILLKELFETLSEQTGPAITKKCCETDLTLIEGIYPRSQRPGSGYLTTGKTKPNPVG